MKKPKQVKDVEVKASMSPKTRMMNFLQAYHDAPDDAEITLQLGTSEHGEHGLLVRVAGDPYVLSVADARAVADICEEGIRKFPLDPDNDGFANLILWLRGAADRAEAGKPFEQ
jgi:hypothetical protein